MNERELRARVHTLNGEWRLKIEGPAEDVRELMGILEDMPFRIINHGGAYPCTTLSATFVPRKRYKFEKIRRKNRREVGLP